jgi:hypothetical protein
MSIATPICFQDPFAWKIFFYPFTMIQCLSLSVRCISCKQQMVKYCFFKSNSQKAFFVSITVFNFKYFLLFASFHFHFLLTLSICPYKLSTFSNRILNTINCSNGNFLSDDNICTISESGSDACFISLLLSSLLKHLVIF